MKDKIVIKVPKIDITKETPEQRLERVRHGNVMRTRIVPNKKKLTNKQQRQLNNKERKNYE